MSFTSYEIFFFQNSCETIFGGRRRGGGGEEDFAAGYILCGCDTHANMILMNDNVVKVTGV